MTIRPLILISALAVAPLLTGCLAFQDKTVGESLDEGATGSQIKTKMFADSAFKKFGEVKVEVAGRFVLLAGRVPSESDRKEAEEIAWESRAVDEVANELVVEPRNLGRDANDSWIREQLRAKLLADRKVKGVNYNVVVYNGEVYLLGLAQSNEELRRAAETASTVRGVTKVVSYVKMRDRRAAPVLARPEAMTTASAIGQPADVQAQAPPNTISAEPPLPNAPPSIASSGMAPAANPARAVPGNGQIRLAPIEDHAPSTRGAVYSDPYAAPRRNPNNQLEASPK